MTTTALTTLVVLYLLAVTASLALWRFGDARLSRWGRTVALFLLTGGAAFALGRLLTGAPEREVAAPLVLPLEGPTDGDVETLDASLREQQERHTRTVEQLEALERQDAAPVDLAAPDAGGDFAAALLRVRD